MKNINTLFNEAVEKKEIDPIIMVNELISLKNGINYEENSHIIKFSELLNKEGFPSNITIYLSEEFIKEYSLKYFLSQN